MNKDGVIRAVGRLGWTKDELRGARRAARKGRGIRFRPLYAGLIVWAGVFGLLWVFG